MSDSKFWVCGCATDNGEHICDDLYSACVFCDQRKSDCAEIVVPSGMGGVFSVAILERVVTRARVKVINNSNGFDALAPFWVAVSDIERRTRRT